MASMIRPTAVAILLALVGLSAIAASVGARRRRGLLGGSTMALDNVTLFSKRHRLVGRPDRIVKRGKAFIPEEWKSGRRLEPWHEYQFGTYFILIEEHYGVRPPYGLLVLGSGKRHRVRNTDKLREDVLTVAREIREARRRMHAVLPGAVDESRCRACGQRSICTQRPSESTPARSNSKTSPGRR
jgi:CRISPR-associated exonuclease Cas4